MEVREITDRKFLKSICQICLKLVELAATADRKVSKGQRQIGVTKQTNKKPYIFSAKISFLPSLKQFVQRARMVNYGKIFQTSSNWYLNQEPSRGIKWFFYFTKTDSCVQPIFIQVNFSYAFPSCVYMLSVWFH